MASAEQVDIRLQLYHKQFTDSMKRVERAMNRMANKSQRSTYRMQRGFDRVKQNLVALLSATAITAGFRAFTSNIKELVTETDKLIKQADGLNLTVEQFSALAGIAGEAGVERDKFAKGLAKLNKVIQDAGDGLTTYTRAFERLGVDYREANGALKSTEKIFFELKGAVDKYGSSQEVVASLMDIFGARIGPAMVRVLGDMEGSMEEVMERAQRMGVVIDTHLAEKAQDAKNAFDVLGQQMDASAMRMFSPVIEWAEETATVLGKATVALSLFVEGMKDIPDQSTLRLKTEKEHLERRLAPGGYHAQQREARSGGLQGALAAGYAGPSKLETAERKKLAAINQQLENRRAADARKEFQKRQKAVDVREAKIKAAEKQAAEKQAKVDAENAVRQQNRMDEIFSNLRARFGVKDPNEEIDYAEIEADLKESDEKLKRKAEHSAKEAEAQKAENQRALDARAEYRAKAQALQDQADEEALEKQRMREQAKQNLADTFESNLTNAMMRLVDGTSSVEDAFKNLIRQMLMSMIQQQVMAPISKGITGAIFGTAAGGKFTQAGKPLMVGEQGREVFVPSTAGRVLSHPQSERALAGAGAPRPVVINYNIDSTDGPGVRRALQEAAPMIIEGAKAAVAEDMTRPSAFRQTMRGYA